MGLEPLELEPELPLLDELPLFDGCDLSADDDECEDPELRTQLGAGMVEARLLPTSDTAYEEFAAALTKDAAFPKRMGLPEEYGRLAVAIVENPMLNGSTIRLDAGQRFAPK